MIRVIEDKHDYYNPKNADDAIKNMADFLDGRVYAKGTNMEFRLKSKRIKNGFTIDMPDGYTYVFKSTDDNRIKFYVKDSGDEPDYDDPEYWNDIANNILQYIADATPGFDKKPNRQMWSK